MKRLAKFQIDHVEFESARCTRRREVSALRMRIPFYLGLIALLACFPGVRNAAARTWEQVSSMSLARQQPTATLLPDGRALIVGGYFLTNAELFDPHTATWTTTGPVTTNTFQSTATLLPNGKVLVAGGQDYHILASAELFDPA